MDQIRLRFVDRPASKPNFYSHAELFTFEYFLPLQFFSVLCPVPFVISEAVIFFGIHQ